MEPGNLPRPLARAPIPLLACGRSQMSFGERAALEGVLSQLRPTVSVEIGTALGGSLRQIARHTLAEVHAFDLAPREPDRLGVRSHVGDSRFTLPRFLDGLPDDRAVDFALVDGDHTFEGVLSDVGSLVGARACARTVILVHDVANTDVRNGVLAAIDSQPRVVYHELDFMPGYEFAEGPFVGQRWGGLGLIVTGDQRTDGYLDSPAQTLYRR